MMLGLGISEEEEERLLCRACKKNRRCRSKGMCARCYDNIAIRDSIPPLSKFGVRGLGIAKFKATDHFQDFYGKLKLATEPTDALPGTLAKKRVMQQRLERGEMLFHPLDATLSLK